MILNIRLKNENETRNYFVEEIGRNELMSKKHKMISTTQNYIDYLFILACAVTGCISISTFASLLVIPIGITSFAISKPMIKKKKKKNDKTFASKY